MGFTTLHPPYELARRLTPSLLPPEAGERISALLVGEGQKVGFTHPATI